MFVPRALFAALLAAGSCIAIAQSSTAAAEADPDQVFAGTLAGSVGRNVTDAIPAGRRIAIPIFRMAFVMDHAVSAEVRAGQLPGRSLNSAQSSLQVVLRGVDPQTLQAITDRAYADLLAELRGSGREVLPVQRMGSAYPTFKTIASSPAQPYTRTHNGRTAMFFAPTGMPLVLTHFERAWDDPAVRDLANYNKLLELSSKVDAVVITPIIFMDFAKMRSVGVQSGRYARTADTAAELTMSVAAFSSLYLRAEQVRNGSVLKGEEGSFRTTVPIASPMTFGTMYVTSRQLNGSFELVGTNPAPLNSLAGHRTSTRASAETSNEAYAAAAMDAVKRMSSTLGKWFRKYPPAAIVEQPAVQRKRRSL